jgi:hypothetical protein
MKKLSYVIIIFALYFAACQKNLEVITSKRFDIKTSTGIVLVSESAIRSYTKKIIEDRFQEKIGYQITDINTTFDDDYFITTIEYELANNIKSNYILSNAVKFKDLVNDSSLKLTTRADDIFSISCSGTCSCQVVGSGYNVNCACSGSSQTSGPQCSMTIKVENKD